MDVFFSLLVNLLPLYAIIALGWFAGRFYEVDRVSIANLAIFIIVPVVAFSYVSKLEFRAEFILLPVLFYTLHAVFTLVFYALGQRIYPDNRANLLGMSCGASNTGYLGLPIVIMLLPPEWVGVYVFGLVGGLFYEATVYYYVANRGQFDPKASLKRVLKFPILYAIALALLLNAYDVAMPAQLDAFWGYFRGAYIVLGMMIIGVSLSRVAKLVLSRTFLSIVFAVQFVLWPLVALGLITLDRDVLHLFEPEIYKMVMIVSIVPPAANIAAFAAALNLNPEKAATLVLLGTIFALFYIPAVLVLSGFAISP